MVESDDFTHSIFANKQHSFHNVQMWWNQWRTEVLIYDASNTFTEFDYGLLPFLDSYKRNEINGNIRMQSIKHKSNQEICDTNHKRDTFYDNNHWIKLQKIFEISHARGTHRQEQTAFVCVSMDLNREYWPRLCANTIYFRNYWEQIWDYFIVRLILKQAENIMWKYSRVKIWMIKKWNKVVE